MTRGRVWREWPVLRGYNDRFVMPWTWQCADAHDWGDYPRAASSGISMYQWDALDAMNEHLAAHGKDES